MRRESILWNWLPKCTEAIQSYLLRTEFLRWYICSETTSVSRKWIVKRGRCIFNFLAIFQFQRKSLIKWIRRQLFMCLLKTLCKEEKIAITSSKDSTSFLMTKFSSTISKNFTPKWLTSIKSKNKEVNTKTSTLSFQKKSLT